MTERDRSSAADASGPDHGVERHTVDCEWETDDPSWSVVQAVSVATGTDPVDLQPLYYAIDPDAMDRLLTGNRTRSQQRVLSFQFGNCDVTVDASGRIVVSPLE